MSTILRSTIFTYLVVGVLQFQVQAQSSIDKPITLLTRTNDTLHGYIAFKDKFKTYQGVLVKLNNETVSRLYRPADVQSFTIQNGEETLMFETVITDADYSFDELFKLSASPKAELVHDTVFAQLLLQGPRNVYFFIDPVAYKEHYLIGTAQGQGIDLLNKHYRVNESRTAYSLEYRNQLLLLLASPAIPAIHILNTPFRKSAILELVKSYNASISPVSSTYEYKELKAIFHFAASLGGNVTTLKFIRNSTIYKRLEFQPSSGVNAAVSMNIILPYTRMRWSFFSDLLFTSYRLRSPATTYVYYENANWYKSMNETSVKAAYIKLFTAARYTLQGQWSPFFQLGVVNSYACSGKAESTYETKFYSDFSTKTNPFMEFRKYEQSLFAGVGALYRKLGIELRYELGNGFSKQGDTASRMSYGYMLLSYTF
jgi:hypothetical protein